MDKDREEERLASLGIHDNPTLAAPINCRLVKTGAEEGHTLFWERQQERPESE